MRPGKGIISAAVKDGRIGRLGLTHRYDLAVLLETLVQGLLKGVYDHSHPLGRDYMHSSDKRMSFRENGPNGKLARFL
jgi:hypothetical protein